MTRRWRTSIICATGWPQLKKPTVDAGAELKHVYLVMGQYDLVAVVEAPNDETLAKVALGQAALGAFRSTETMRAFTEEEVAKIVAGLS
ncbi:MAG: hypothetical protein QOK03_3196 [Candidatus Binataceae bacterium]|nr:hypothetical protein [Candidatus Binataceae bacterium]